MLERKYILIGIAVLIAVAVAFLFYRPSNNYYIDQNGRIHYPAYRGPVDYSEEKISEDGDYGIYKVIINSNGTDLYGQLWLPNGGSKSGAILFLPGAGGEKTAGKDYAEMFRGEGIAIFALDQRGIGKTVAKVPGSIEEEYYDFIAGRESFQILMVYDALRAFDYLNKRDGIDSNKIVILGESMGGRNALIAGALEPGFKMVVGISTGGYGLQKTANRTVTMFLRSFDPDNYVDLISPRRTVIFHSTEDSVQPFVIGMQTYETAKDPKVFYSVNCKSHGLCEEMKEHLKKEIGDTMK